MTVSDLAALTGLSWDTVKDIIKKALEKGYGHPRLADLRYLSIDEIYLGRQKKFYTLVIDLASGRIVYVAKGKGAEALRKFWRVLRLSQARISTESVLKEADTLYGRWPSLPIDERRKIAEAICEKIVIGKDDIDITLAGIPSSEELCKNQTRL